MKIKRKFQTITVLSIALGLLIGVTLFIGLQNMKVAIHEDYKAHELTRSVFELNLLANDYLSNRTERARKQWQSRYDSVTNFIQNMDLQKSEEQLLQKEILQGHDGLGAIFSRIVTNYTSYENSNEKPAGLSELEDRLIGMLLAKSQSMVTSAGQLNDKSDRKLISAQRKSSSIVMLFVSIIMFIIAVNLFFTRKSIIEPISKLQNGTQIISEGKFDFKVATASKNEIGDLSRAFDQMTERLQKITVSRDKLEEEIKVRERAEEVLWESQSFLVKAQEIARVGSWKWQSDSDEGIWSDQTFRILGYAPNEIQPTYKWLLGVMHPDDREPVMKGIEESMSTGESFDMEYRLTRKDQKEIVVHSRGEVVSNRETIGMIGAMHDITELKQAEQAMREGEKRYRSLFEDNPIETIVVDKEARITMYNKAKRISAERLPRIGDVMY